MANKWIDLSRIPKKSYNNKLHIDWKRAIGCVCKFNYNGVLGEFLIKDRIDTKKFLVVYNNKDYIISTDSLRECKLSSLFETNHKSFKFKVGEIISSKESVFKIIENIHKIRTKKGSELTEKGYILECQSCKNTFERFETQITDKHHDIWCPYCYNRKIKVGFNDLWTTNKEMAKLLYNPEDGYNNTEHSSNRVEWKCPTCNSIIIKTFNEVSKNGLACPNCSETMSYPNKFMHSLLKEIGIEFTPEKSFSWSENRKYDFYLEKNNLKIIIEMHGSQHYESNTFHTLGGRTLEEEQENDLLKFNNAINNKIDEYIVIDSRMSDFGYIKNNVMNSKLIELFDLNKINWCKVGTTIEEPMVVTIANVWNQGIHDVAEIRKTLGISKKKTTSLLNRAKDCGLCDYNPNISQKIGRIKMLKTRYQKNSKPIYCFETKEFFGNYTICSEIFNKRNVNIHKNNILSVLNKKCKTCNGYTFCYISREEFNYQKKNNSSFVYGDFFECLEVA